MTPPIWLRRYAAAGALLAGVIALPAARGAAVPGGDAPPPTAVDARIAQERAAFRNRFALMPHKPSYMLPVSYAQHIGDLPFDDPEGDVEPLEVKLQISLKLPLKRNLFGDNGHLSFGYTQLSFWQAYNAGVSSPFRETNHEPELMLSFFNDYRVFGVRNRIVTVGFVHQSNGQAGERSRSWNRVYVNAVFERSRWAFGVRPWYRVPEDDDDNPDIEDYLGHGEVIAAYRRRTQVIDVMLRHTLDSSNRGAIRIGWSFPINERVDGYVQYFNGYGESLMDYNRSVNRVGIGILLANWI